MMEQNEVLIEAIKILGSGAAGFISALIIHRLQAKRRIIRYTTSWMQLFNVGSGSKIRVSVDQALMTGNPSDAGQLLIKEAFGHAVSLRNFGNDTIEQIYCDVIIDENAVIIDQYTEPKATNDYKIECKKDDQKSNVLNIAIPYLNPGSQLTTYFQSTMNSNPAICYVTSRAKGAVARPVGPAIVRYFITLVVGLFVGIYLYYMEPILGWRPEAIIDLGGGKIVPKTTTAVEWPFHTSLLILGTAAVIMIYAGWRLVVSSMATRLPWQA